MQTVTYTYRCVYTGITYRCRAENVATIKDEPYPPGGELRVMRNKEGQIISGPLVSELLSFEVLEETI